MDKNTHPFSCLTEEQLDAIIDRAQRERAEAIATAFIWMGRLLRALLIAPFAGLRLVFRRPNAPHKALHQ